MQLALPAVDSSGDLVALLLLAVVAAPVWVIDVRRRSIPDVIVLPTLALVMVSRSVWGTAGWGGALVWAGAAGLLLFIPALVRPDGMGMGDVKLATLLGACVGALALVAVLVALVAGAVGGAAHAWARGVRLRDATIPFGPFLLGAALAVVLPVALVHSAHAAGRSHHPPHASAALRPACLRLGRIGRHQAVGGPSAACGPGHAGRCRARCGGAAP